ncbi:MAG TPA: hypothetical protein VF695_07740 [Sphingomonas sp.]|jgi:hypothetical protein
MAISSAAFPTGAAESVPASVVASSATERSFRGSGIADLRRSLVSDVGLDLMKKRAAEAPVTPDRRYIVVRGRLWRRSDPRLSELEREALVDDLMRARASVGHALRQDDADALAVARRRVDEAKWGLGERGPVWWDDDAPDENRRMARNSTYADWWAEAELDGEDRPRP